MGMTKDQLVTKLELDTALFALAASETGIVGGTAVGLVAAAVGVPALLGAVAFAGLTAVAAFAPDVILPDLEKAESATDYFSPVTIALLPISPFISPTEDHFLAARVLGRLWESTDIPESLNGAIGSGIQEIEKAKDKKGTGKELGEITELFTFWAGKLSLPTTPQQNTSTATPGGGSGTSRGQRDTNHDAALRPFSGFQPGKTDANKTKDSSTDTENQSSQKDIDRANKQFQKNPGDIEQDDKSLINSPQVHEMRQTSTTPQDSGGGGREGHGREVEFHPGPERYGGGGEGADHGEGRVA